MAKNLLQSKIQIPGVRPSLITRPRLLEFLNQGLTHKIILISAPAGFGKTTLLADWLKTTSLPAAWLSLDEDDNDFARFLSYLTAALQGLDPSLDDTALDLLQTPQPGLKKAALATLLNQIERVQIESLLVLDDYHFLHDPEIHQALDYLVNYLPPTLHLVISTRADPPLGLARLRAQGTLLEIRLDDLRFSEEEAGDFLSQELSQPIPEAGISLLTSRTEGWISGLQMAAISLRGKEDPESFIQSFSGSNKYILDYLIEEVLQRQDPEIQEFLLQTSLLERLNGELCDHLLGRSGSQEILEALEKANLFLIPLDERRAWYRYHKLFRDLLNLRLSLDQANQIAGLHIKASIWYEDQDWPDQAIEHALQSGDHNRAAGLIAREAEHTLMRSEANTYRRWISHLPDGLIQENPNLVFYESWARMLKGSDFEALLTTAANLRESYPQLRGRLDTLQAFILISQGNFSEACQFAEEALTRLSAQEGYFRGMAFYILSLGQILHQDMELTLENLSSLTQREEYNQNPMLKVMVLSQAARAHIHLGELGQARQLYEEALAGARDRMGGYIPIAGEALMGLGDLLRELGHLDQAADLILEGIELTRQWRQGAAIEGYLYLSRIKQLQGEWAEANQLLKKAREMAEEYDVMALDDRLADLWQARLWSFEGRALDLKSWIKIRQIDRPLVPLKDAQGLVLENYLLAREKTVQARYLLLTGETQQALSLVEQLSANFEELNWTDILIEIYLLEFLVQLNLDRKKEADSKLDQALRLGQAGGFIGLFLEIGPALETALASFKQDPDLCSYIEALEQAFLPAADQPGSPPQQPLLEPLSERELEVLGYLAGSLTTPEIAGEMFLSVNTIRTHIKNIYQKLGVHKRSAAVRRSRNLSLL